MDELKFDAKSIVHIITPWVFVWLFYSDGILYIDNMTYRFWYSVFVVGAWYFVFWVVGSDLPDWLLVINLVIIVGIMTVWLGAKTIDHVGTEYRRMMQEAEIEKEKRQKELAKRQEEQAEKKRLEDLEASKSDEEREYERIVLRLNDEMAKIEERLRECNDIEQLLSNDYSAAYKDYAAINDEEGRKILFDELKITKKRQLALPKYREECEVMTARIRSLLRRLDQEQMIPANIANVYEDINKTIQSLFAGNFFDFATRHDISDAEVERLITAP